MRKLTSVSLSIEPSFLLTITCAILLLPVKWVLSWLVAAAIHEFCHYIAIKVIGVRIYSFTISGNGAVIKTDTMQQLQELFCTLAGPIGALIILLFSKYVPRIVLCVCVQSAFNLLPLYPLDGGRALFALISHFKGDQIARRCCNCITKILLLGIIIAAIMMNVNYRIGYIPVMLAGFLLFRQFQNNYSLQR